MQASPAFTTGVGCTCNTADQAISSAVRFAFKALLARAVQIQIVTDLRRKGLVASVAIIKAGQGAHDISADSRDEGQLAPSCILPGASLFDSVQSSMQNISYSFHMEKQQQELVSEEWNVSESVLATHAERCINVEFDSTRLFSPSGATVHLHMT